MKWWTKTSEFLAEVKSEMKKASFPSRPEVIGTTVVVIITSVVFAVFLWLADLVIIKAYEGILKVMS